PVKYCIAGMGSMSLGTITPWSDLEHIILIESGLDKEEEKVKDFFRKMTLLLYIKVVNFGETILPSLSINEFHDYRSSNRADYDWFFDRVMPRGIGFDGEMA